MPENKAVFSGLNYYGRLAAATGHRAALEWLLKNLITRPAIKPIVILGNQKSGTSAVAALLAKATGQTASIDLKMQVVCPLYDRLESGNLSFTRFVGINSYSFSRQIVKEPELTFHYDQLIRRFPHSKVVFVHREATENIRSIYERLGFSGDTATIPNSKLAHLPRAWQLILGCDKFGDDQSVPVLENLCQRWNIAAETEIMAGNRAEHISYKAFKKDKEPTIRNLAERLSLPIKHSIREDLNINYQPPSRSGLKAANFFPQHNLDLIFERTKDNALKLEALDSLNFTDVSFKC